MQRLPSSSVALYETLRSDFSLGRACREGLTALRFHGMWQGLKVLLEAKSVAAAASQQLTTPPSRSDTQFVRLLANLVLHAQSEVTHVC